MSAPQLYIERDVSKYVVHGKRVPSVTEVLALAGIVDFSGVPPDALQAAANRGRIAHQITAVHDLREDVTKVDGYAEVFPYLDAYSKFRFETGFDPTLIEYSVVSQEHLYAGTLDRLGVAKDGCIWILDLKTSLTIPRWVGLQLAGYELPARRLVDTPRIRRAALRLKKDGTYSLTEFADRSDYPNFLASVRVAHWRLAHGGISL